MEVVYRGARTLQMEDRVAAAPGPGQVAIEVAYTGICGTDLHVYHGDMDARVGPAAVLGHEMSGRIAAVGEEVAGWSVGQAVTVMPTRPCGRCAACQRGNSHICHAMDFLGLDSPGAMQSILERSGRPRRSPSRHAVARARRACRAGGGRRARRPAGRGCRAGEHVVVVGGGPVGVLIAILCRHQGGQVLLVEPNPFRRAVAQRCGLDVVDPRTTDVVALVNSRTAGAGAEVAFEVSGSASGVDTAVDVLTTRGRLVMVAIHAQPRSVSLHRFFLRELEMLGARLYQRDDIAEAIRLIASGAIPADQLITHILPAKDFDAAFAALEEGAGAMKVLLDWQGGRPMSGLFDLSGQVAVVTGARRGIGLAMAVALAEAGADIIGVSANLEQSGSDVEGRVRGAGRRFTALRADLGDRAAVHRLAVELKALGPIDILVNNGGTIARKPAAEHPDEMWDRVIEVNLSSQFILSREIGREMVSRGRGKIIFTASMLSFQGGINVPGYTASKSGIAGPDQGPRERVGRARCQRQRHRARLHRDRQHPGAARRRAPQRSDSRPDTGRPLGTAGRPWRGHRFPRFGRVGLRQRHRPARRRRMAGVLMNA